MERVSLPFIDLFSFQGEFTKSSPEVLKPSQLRVLENAELFSVYGALRRVRGNKPVLSIPYTEGGVVKPTEWIGLHKYPNLNGNLTRQVLFAAGTTLNRINDDGSITEKYSGLTEGVHRTSDQMDQFLFITGQDPLHIGTKDHMLKYDGTNVHNWGVVAPGEQETVIYAFDDETDPVMSEGLVRNNAQYTWDGSGSLEFYDTAAPYIVTATITLPSISILPVGTLGEPEVANRARLYMFIDPERYTDFVNGEMVLTIRIGTDASHYYSFIFQYGDFVQGWNIINLDFTLPTGTADPSGLLDATNLNHLFISVTNVLTSVPISGIYFDRLCILDRGTPALELEYANRGVGDYSYDDFAGATINRCNSTTGFTVTGATAITLNTNTYREGTASITWDAGGRTANVTTITYNPPVVVATTDMTRMGAWVNITSFTEASPPSGTAFLTINTYTGPFGGPYALSGGSGTAVAMNNLSTGWNWVEWPVAFGGLTINRIEFVFTYTAFASPTASLCSVDNIVSFYNGYLSNEGNYLATENPGTTFASGDVVDIARWAASGQASVPAEDVTHVKQGTGSQTYTRSNIAGDSIMTWTDAGLGIGIVGITSIGFWIYIDGRDDMPAPGNTFLTVTTRSGPGPYVLIKEYEFTTNDLNSPNGWNYVQLTTEFSPAAYVAPVTQIEFKMHYISGTHFAQKCSIDDVRAFYNNDERAISPSGDGVYSTAVYKINPNTATARIDVDLTNVGIATPIDLIGTAQQYKPAGGNWLLWVYVPSTSELNDPCALVTIGDPTLANSNTYSIPKSQITHSGWNEVFISLSEPIDTSLAGANLNIVARIRVDFLTVSPGVTGGPWRVDFWHHNETAAGNLIGEYTYKVTYQTKYGLESNAGPVSATITAPLGGAEVALSQIPISDDPQVIQRNVYRTVAGGAGEWLQLAYIRDNVTTTYVDKIPDVSLGSTTPPEAGAGIFDSSPPPYCGIVKIYNRTVFMAGDPLNPHILYFSKDDDPDAFPVLNAFQLDSRITGIYECYLGLMITTDTDHWRLIGSNPDYTLEKVIEEIGAVGPRAVGTGKLEGWSMDQYGMRLYNLQEMVRISEPIQNQYEHLPNRYDVHTVHSRRHNSILQFNKDADGKYSNNFMYSYVMDNMRSGGWSRLVIPTACTLDPEHSAEVEDNEGTIKIYVSSSDGQIYEVMADDSANWISSDGSQTPIHFKARTMWMRLGAAGGEMWEATGRVTPRYFELRAMEMDGQDSTWNVTIETSFISQDNPNIGVVDRATLQMYVPAGAGLVRLPIRQKNAGDYVRITIENTDLDRDVVLLGARLFFWVQPSQSSIEPIPELQYGE